MGSHLKSTRRMAFSHLLPRQKGSAEVTGSTSSALLCGLWVGASPAGPPWFQLSPEIKIVIETSPAGSETMFVSEVL